MEFNETERQDDRWQLREEVLIAEVERESLAKLHELLHTAESSMAQYVEQKIFDHHYKEAQKQYHHVARLLYPYGTDTKAADERILDTLEKVWLAEYGDPNGEAMHRTLEYLRTS